MHTLHEPQIRPWSINENNYELEFMFMKHYAPNRCEPSIEALIFFFDFFFLILFFFFWGGGGSGRVGVGGQGVSVGGGVQGRCELRSEVFVKIQKKYFFSLGGGGGRVGGGGGGGGGGKAVGSGWWGFRVDVNAMLGVGGHVGYGGSEPRIEGTVQCTKRYCTILRKLKKMCVWGGGRGQFLNPKHSLCI